MCLECARFVSATWHYTKKAEMLLIAVVALPMTFQGLSIQLIDAVTLLHDGEVGEAC